MRASAVAVVLLGCGAGTTPNAALDTPLADAGERPALVSSAKAQSAPAAPPLAGVRLEPDAAPATVDPKLELEFTSPVFGEILPELGIRAHEVRVTSAALPAGHALWVAFDGLRPIPARAGGVVRLGELVPEDRPIAIGPHSLLAVVADADGRLVRRSDGKPVFSLSDFYIGERRGSLPGPAAARLFCLGPAGTFHGASTERPRVQLLALGAVPRPVPLRFEASAGAFETRVDPDQPVRVVGLPAGDVRLRVGSPGGPEAECVATLNPERREGS